jgi:predicted nucleotidyltransferase
MNNEAIKNNVLRTLLYYDIFDHPLSEEEVYSFLPENSVLQEDIILAIRHLSENEDAGFGWYNGYVYIKPKIDTIQNRFRKKQHARKMWIIARLMTHVIKRCPFIKAVFVTGSLSKHSTDKHSDIDYMVITQINRLWIARTLLMLFKKIFLFNSYKYFCVNYLITEDNLEIPLKNIFTATEIATLKATHGSAWLENFIKSNLWIKNYFPNYKELDPVLHSSGARVNNRRSVLQKILELPFKGNAGNRLDKFLMKKILNHQKKKYAHLNDTTQGEMFEASDNVSRTHPANSQTIILQKYNEKLKEFNL